jgi:integrase
MPRRGENIYKRKDGRWEGRILMPDGTYRYVYAKTYREVREKKKNYEDNLESRAMKLSGTITGAAGLFEHWLNGDVMNQVKPSTYGNYYSCMLKYVIPFFSEEGNEPLTEFTAARFAKSIKDNAPLSEAYKRKILTIFKTALKEILKGSAQYPAIAEAIKPPKEENTVIQVFSISEQRLVENAVFQAKDIRALGILLTFYTGIRLGELCALKWSDLDFDAGTMSVTRTVTRVKNFQPGKSKTTLYIGPPKSRKSIRKIPLPDFLLKLFGKYAKWRTDENSYLFSGTDIPMDPRAYEKLYKRILKGAGVKDRKFHTIRHTFATRALELGVDVKTLSELLGHSNVSITLNIYAHSLLEQKKIAMDRFNEMHITHMAIASFAVADSVTSSLKA